MLEQCIGIAKLDHALLSFSLKQGFGMTPRAERRDDLPRAEGALTRGESICSEIEKFS